MEFQASTTMQEYDKIIDRIRSRFPDALVSGAGEERKEEYVWKYLHDLHPRSWTVLGNCEPSSEKVKWIDKNWSNASSFGRNFPLFGARTTTVSKETTMLCFRNKLLIEADNWVVAGHDVTPHAFKYFVYEKKQVVKQTVMPASLCRFYVFDAFDRNRIAGSTVTYEVNMASGDCRRCPASENTKIPCRHIQVEGGSAEQAGGARKNKVSAVKRGKKRFRNRGEESISHTLSQGRRLEVDDADDSAEIEALF
ncbi:hypothetical protein GQ600_22272 [Phytophthora cactorum]|nr:hypothetical protein GQ600_22272 [Phytophthora cactorum]